MIKGIYLADGTVPALPGSGGAIGWVGLNERGPPLLHNLAFMTLEELFLNLGKPAEFKPHWDFNPVVDTLEVWWENVQYYADPISAEIELLRAMDDDRVIGVEVHGIKSACRNKPDLLQNL